MLSSNGIIRRQNSAQFGKVGAFFRMPDTEDIYGISCNHVIANLNNGSIGDILCDNDNQPLGALSDWVILKANDNNITEFALYKVSNPNEVQWAHWKDFKGGPMGFKPAQVGDAIFYPQDGKVAQGVIRNVGFTMEIKIAENNYTFTNCIKIESGIGSSFSDHGDSGGSVLSADNYLVGIIVGVKDDNTASYAIPFVDGILNYYVLKPYQP